MLACDDIMPTGWTPAEASSTLVQVPSSISYGDMEGVPE